MYGFLHNVKGTVSIFVLVSTNQEQSYFPAEWHKQSAVHLVWPSDNSDWKDNYEEVIACYLDIARSIIGRQKLLIIFPDEFNVDKVFSKTEQTQIKVVFEDTNDTWVRDYGGLAVVTNGEKQLLDFKFNVWGVWLTCNCN